MKGFFRAMYSLRSKSVDGAGVSVSSFVAFAVSVFVAFAVSCFGAFAVSFFVAFAERKEVRFVNAVVCGVNEVVSVSRRESVVALSRSCMVVD